MRTIFVDTGPFYARCIPRDQSHADAVRLWADVKRVKPALVTSHFVLDEVATLLARAVGNRSAVARMREIYASPLFTIETVDREIEEAALDEMEGWNGPPISFTDCTSIALMRRDGIREAFTFDRDFSLAGFVRFGE